MCKWHLKYEQVLFIQAVTLPRKDQTIGRDHWRTETKDLPVELENNRI